MFTEDKIIEIFYLVDDFCKVFNDELKNIAQVEPSRHRSFANFLTNALGALAAYCFLPKKPSINLELVDNPWPSLFYLMSNSR